MKPFAVVVLAMAVGGLPVSGEPPQFSGDKTSWHGFDRYDFLMDESDLTVKPFKAGADERNAVKTSVKGHLRCVVVVPKRAAPGNPWSWRGYYFDHEPQAEIELLERGFHIGFICPDKVSCIYAENPILRSRMSKEQPLDRLAPLAKAGVPVVHVCGAHDPWLDSQTRVLEKRYKELGGTITVIVDEGKGHFPTAPRDAKPVVDLIVGYQSAGEPVRKPAAAAPAGQPRAAPALRPVRDYRFDKTISRLVLENYLSRSISVEGILNGRGNFDDNVRMLKGPRTPAATC